MPQRALTRQEEKLYRRESRAKLPELPSKHVAGRPRYPANMSPATRRAYKTVAHLLENRRALTEGDEALLHIFATVFARWETAVAHLREEGEIVHYTIMAKDGTPLDRTKVSPWLGIAAASEKRLLDILKECGLTPAQREKIKQLEPPVLTPELLDANPLLYFKQE